MSRATSLITAMLPMLLTGCSAARTHLILVHVECQWDGAERVAAEVRVIAAGRRVRMLVTDPGDWRAASLVPAVKPRRVIVAPGGHWLGFAAPGERVEFCGGYFRGCLANAVAAVARRSPGMTAVLPMRGVYHGPRRTLEEMLRDNWRGDTRGFLRYVEEVGREFGFERPSASLEGGSLLLWDRTIGVEK